MEYARCETCSAQRRQICAVLDDAWLMRQREDVRLRIVADLTKASIVAIYSCIGPGMCDGWHAEEKRLMVPKMVPHYAG